MSGALLSIWIRSGVQYCFQRTFTNSLQAPPLAFRHRWDEARGLLPSAGHGESSDAIEAARSRGVPENFLSRAEALRRRAGATLDIGRFCLRALPVAGYHRIEAVLLSVRHDSARPCRKRRFYALRLSDGSLYIGETESLASRVERHRSNYGRDIQIGIVRVQGGRSARGRRNAGHSGMPCAGHTAQQRARRNSIVL